MRGAEGGLSNKVCSARYSFLSIVRNTIANTANMAFLSELGFAQKRAKVTADIFDYRPASLVRLEALPICGESYGTISDSKNPTRRV